MYYPIALIKIRLNIYKRLLKKSEPTDAQFPVKEKLSKLYPIPEMPDYGSKQEKLNWLNTEVTRIFNTVRRKELLMFTIHPVNMYSQSLIDIVDQIHSKILDLRIFEITVSHEIESGKKQIIELR